MTPPKDYSRLGGYLMFINVLLIIQVCIGVLSLTSSLPVAIRAGSIITLTPLWYTWLDVAIDIAVLALGVLAIVSLYQKKKMMFSLSYIVRLCLGIASSVLGIVMMNVYSGAIQGLYEEVMDQTVIYEQLPNADEFVRAVGGAAMGISYTILVLPLLVNTGFLVAWCIYSRRSKRAAAYFDPNYQPPAWYYPPVYSVPYPPPGAYSVPSQPAVWPPPGAQHPYPPPQYPMQPAPPTGQQAAPPPPPRAMDGSEQKTEAPGRTPTAENTKSPPATPPGEEDKKDG